MTTMEALETEQFICSVFSLPKKCYPRFNKFQKQLLSVGQRFLVTLEKFHKLIQTEETGKLDEIKRTVKNLADAKAVQIVIFGKYHDEISPHNLVTAKDSKYLTTDCVQSRLIRNEWINKSMQCSDAEGKPVVYVYLVHVDKNYNFKEGMVDCDKLTQVLLEVLAQVLQCLMVEVLAKIYGIKDYRLHQMLEAMVFKEECSITIKHCVRDNLLQSLPKCIFQYECKNLQEEKGRKKLCDLFSKTRHDTFLKELEKIANTDLKKLAHRVHEELEKRVMATERNLAIQQKLGFEMDSILKQTVTAIYRSHQLPSRNDLSSGLKDDLLGTEDVTGVAMIFGELQIHVRDCSVEKKKVVSKKIEETIAKHKYGHSYKIGFITKKPEYYPSVGMGLFSPRLERRGTLGGFMTDLDNNLYCLTCAHVISDNNVDVYVEKAGQQNEQIMIGQSISVDIQPDEPHLSVDAVDIMAVKVKPDQIPRCMPFFKTTDDNSYGPSQILPALDCSLGEHHCVYKWGAKTNLTYGFLHTGYYNDSLFSDGVLDKYTYILVEPLPVDDASFRYFAERGDSGAIICAEGEDNCIQTVGMVQGGELEVKDVHFSMNYSIGFYLWCALDKLMVRSKLCLCTIRFDEEKLQQIQQNQLHIKNNYLCKPQ